MALPVTASFVLIMLMSLMQVTNKEFYDFDNWGQYAVADAAFDVQCDAINTESEPMFMIRAERSLTEKTEVLRFVRDRDYTVEMTSFEADKLARLARNLNELHETMQEEMTRLGW